MSELGAEDCPPRRVMLLGATGTIGRAVTRELVDRGHDVVCPVRHSAGAMISADGIPENLGADIRVSDVTVRASLEEDGFAGENFHAVISCLASRTGVAEDALRVDYQANLDALELAKSAGVKQFILLSAICVQKPRLAFQKAKLAFEDALMKSGMTYSIVRPTAFFKSLSGQLVRVRQGKPFLVFGDGRLTACKPISDRDLAIYIADCLDTKDRHNRVLPIGGPGPAITPREQGEYLFSALGLKPQFRSVPPAMLSAAAGVCSAAARVAPALSERAEYARIGHYYATESMLVWDQENERYDAANTPSVGHDTLFNYYQEQIELSAHKFTH